MDNATSQQAIEILRMIYRKTQQGHTVSFNQESIGKRLQVSIDDSHNHATWRALWGDDENQNLETIIHGLYYHLVHKDSGWVTSQDPKFLEWRERLPAFDIDGGRMYLPGGDIPMDNDEIFELWESHKS